jgi:hypothetical protein
VQCIQYVQECNGGRVVVVFFLCGVDDDDGYGQRAGNDDDDVAVFLVSNILVSSIWSCLVSNVVEVIHFYSTRAKQKMVPR